VTQQTEIAAWIVGLLIALLLASSCGAAWFSANTQSCYEAGDVTFCYKSSKNQENFKAKVAFYPDRSVQTLDIQTTATTAESAIAAASASVAAMADAIVKLIPILEKAAAMGGS